MSVDPVQLLREARAAIKAEDYARAVGVMQQLVDHDRETENTSLEIVHRSNLALLQNRLGFSEEALEHLGIALGLAQAEDNRAAEEGILGNIGIILRETGEHDAAVERLEAALVIADEIDDERGRGNWLSALGLAHDDMGNLSDALTCHREAVEVARRLQDQKGLASRLGHVGNTLMSTGQTEQALEVFHESVEVYRTLGDRTTVALRLGIIGNIYAELGRTTPGPVQKEAYFVQALAHYRETLHIAREVGDRVSEAALLRGMGNVYGNMADYAEAMRHFRDAAVLFERLGMTEQVGVLEENIALARKLRDEAEA